MDHLSQKYSTKTALISLTDFYRELTDQERAQYKAGKYNLDHPSKFLSILCMIAFLNIWWSSIAAFDFDLLHDTITSLLSGKPTNVPVWDSIHHTKYAHLSPYQWISLCWPIFIRVGTRLVEPVDVILLEGTLVLYSKPIRELMFTKIFLDVDSDQRLTNRGIMHIIER